MPALSRPDPEGYVLRSEAERWLGISRMTLWRYRELGMPWVDLQGRILFPVGAVRRWWRRRFDVDPGPP